MKNDSVHQFAVEKLNGEEVSLENYRGKVLLIVNTASECGFTPQLEDLEKLRSELQGKDFEILAFPSNDFGAQEPLDGPSLGEFCTVKYGAQYPVFAKIRVRGPYAHPLYQFLASKKQNGRLNSTPRWNFHKYLVDKEGRVSDFFYPFTRPDASRVKKKINKLLSK